MFWGPIHAARARVLFPSKAALTDSALGRRSGLSQTSIGSTSRSKQGFRFAVQAVHAILQILNVQLDIEPLAGPSHERIAIDPLVTAGVLLGEVIEPGHDRILDFLSVVATDVVSLELKDEVSQAVMKPVAAEGYEYTYVIMPMRV